MSLIQKNHHSDMHHHSWALRLLPEKMIPYAQISRLDRPVGFWLLALPCLWSLMLASRPDFHWDLILVFSLGAILMRSAGCTINDILDRKIDAQVERTAQRPIANGSVSVKNATLYLAAQLGLAALLLLTLRLEAIYWGLLSLPLIFCYPLMKRITWWPQVFLGITWKWGIFVAWAAVTGGISIVALYLYLAGILLTIGYDTIYAYQDLEGDEATNMKSTARLFGQNQWTKLKIAPFYAGTVVFLTLAFQAANLPDFAFFGLTIASLHLLWQLWVWDPKNNQSSLQVFKSNRDFELLILIIILLTYIG